MKKIIFAISFIFALAFVVLAQNSPCPKVSVIGPSGLTKPGDSMTFTANISSGNLDKPKYNWIISAGTIVSGQETSTITIATTNAMDGQTVTATVDVSGVPPGCDKEASGTGELERSIVCWLPRRIDQYGRISWADEKVRMLNGVIVELKNDATAVAHFIIYSPEKENSPSLKNRFARITKYLTETHKIAKERVQIVFGGHGDGSDRTTVYVIPIGLVPPTPE